MPEATEKSYLTGPFRLWAYGQPYYHRDYGLRSWSSTIQCSVQSLHVVVLRPLPDRDLSLDQAVEDLAIEQFISHSSVKTLDKSVFIGRSRLDVLWLRSNLRDPVPDDWSKDSLHCTR